MKSLYNRIVDEYKQIRLDKRTTVRSAQKRLLKKYPGKRGIIGASVLKYRREQGTI